MKEFNQKDTTGESIGLPHSDVANHALPSKQCFTRETIGVHVIAELNACTATSITHTKNTIYKFSVTENSITHFLFNGVITDLPKTEEWKPVKGFENKYHVSDLGNVRSLNYYGTKKIKNLKLVTNNYGYHQVNLCKPKVRKIMMVHRLVANAFIPTVEGKPIIDHINNNRTDNRVGNLRWATRRENQQNLKANKNGTTSSRFVGVSWEKNIKKFRASIHVNGVTTRIDYFDTEEDAAKAYDRVNLENGFPAVNFPNFD